MKLIKKFIPYYKPYIGVFLFDLVCASVLSVIDLAFPQFLRILRTTLFLEEPEVIIGRLGIIALVLLAMYIVRSLCKYYVTYQGHMMGARMESGMRKDLFDHIQGLSLDYFDDTNTGELMARVKDDIDKIRGLGLGADDYITKPFSPSELVARVKAHLNRYDRLIGNSAVKNDVIEIRGLKIDKTARRVFVNGEERSFTTKEFDLLSFLASNPNHVYTKEELFRNIWNMESIGDIATVTVHIKKIREKIEFDTSKPQYIETIWGVGYRFKI